MGQPVQLTQEIFDTAFETVKRYIDRKDGEIATRLAALEEKLVALSARVTAAEAVLQVKGKVAKQIITRRDAAGNLIADVVCRRPKAA